MKFICKLPKWLGGGHVWRRLNKKEIDGMRSIFAGNFNGDVAKRKRICVRCGAERFTRERKSTAIIRQAAIDLAPALNNLADK